MRRGEKTFPVAMAHELCPICAKEMPLIVIGQRLASEETAEKFKENFASGAIGFSKKPCDDCQKMVEQGIVAIIVDESKSDDMKNPWRTGQLVCLREQAVRKLFKDDVLPTVLAKRAFFMDYKAADQIGLLQQFKT